MLSLLVQKDYSSTINLTCELRLPRIMIPKKIASPHSEYGATSPTPMK